MPDQNFAIEIKTPYIANLVCAIDPGFSDLPYEDMHLHFFVFDIDQEKPGVNALVPPAAFYESWDHIENGSTLTVKHFVRK